ncbi:MAG: ATP-dependent nuclease subunit B-like protein, partial [Bryobacterales bacterium]|nr:ATP-dependent nuclease subunit B-like protein [Bryobacterales bacterium]
IVDYKYSSAVNTKKKVEDVTLLQGPLYVSGARKDHDVSAMVYYNVRTDPNHQVPKPFGWGTVPGVNANFGQLTDEWVTEGLTKARRAVEEFRSGRVLPRPLDAKNCRYCDFRDACRWEFTAAIGAAGN